MMRFGRAQLHIQGHRRTIIYLEFIHIFKPYLIVYIKIAKVRDNETGGNALVVDKKGWGWADWETTAFF